MRQGLIGLMAILVLALCAGPACSAPTELTVQQTLNLESEPLDMVTAPRTRRVYVLNHKGEILVYSYAGKLKGKVNVGADVFRIKPGPSENVLFLLRKNNKSMQAVTIDVTENIDIKGSPFKGEKAAPVAVTVFSDFQ